MSNMVAIVGRPNVGKSTLFNRLTETRQAITAQQSGITRDRHYGKAEWTDKTFTVIDTGGYVKDGEDIFESAIRKQVHLAIEEADVILFVVDVYEGITDLDKDFANILRCFQKPLYVVANKADNTQRQQMFGSFYALGLPADIYAVSAINGHGTGDLLDAVITHFKVPEKKITQIPHIAIIGRPNVGKSSFINVLLNTDRNIVTDLAGTTRDSIDTHYKAFGKNFMLTDTAGIRRKIKVKEDIEFYSVLRARKAIERSDVCIILTDATLGMEAQDLNIIRIVLENKKGIMVMVNKWDLINKGNQTAYQTERQIKEKLGSNAFIPIVFTSVHQKQRIFKAIQLAIDIYKRKTTKIATSVLNNTLLKDINTHPPPAHKAKYIRIKYVTQLPTYSPVFAFFCNYPKYIKQPYMRFLENRIRQHFDFEGVPIKLVFREK